ncbi:transposase family protein [Streptomyces spiralis]
MKDRQRPPLRDGEFDDAQTAQPGERLDRRHTYTRRLADRPLGGRRVLLRLRIRRFFCDNGPCPRRTTAEQVSYLTTRYRRRTLAGGRMVQAIGLAVGEPGRARVGSPPAPGPAVWPGVVTLTGTDGHAEQVNVYDHLSPGSFILGPPHLQAILDHLAATGRYDRIDGTGRVLTVRGEQPVRVVAGRVVL